MVDVPICFRLDVQLMLNALSRAFCNAGSSMAAKMAMMAMTTNSSINVNVLFIMAPVFNCFAVTLTLIFLTDF